MNKILCIGEALIDMICTDKGMPLSQGDHFLKKAGGAPTNVAAAIAALGGKVGIAAKVGMDPFGQHLADVLLDFGVETQWLIRDPDYFTTLAFVSLMENGERDFYFNRGADARLSIPDLDRLDLNEFSIVHFGSATAFLPGPLQETYAHLLRLAGQTDRLISFDPNYRHLLYKDRQEDYTRQCWQFLESCHFCKLSDEEAMLVTGCRNVEESLAVLLSRTNAVYAITLGKSGTLLGCSEKTGLVPSIPVVPVDTTGAGDAFVGAVLFQLSSRKPGEVRDMSFEDWQLVVARGNKAGARTCEYLGAMEAFRHLSDQIFN